MLATEKAELQRAKEVAEAQLAEVQRGRQATERQLAEAQQRMQAQEDEWRAQLRAREEEARRAAQQAAAAPAPAGRAPLAPHRVPAEEPMHDAIPDADDFEDAENLPNISKMTVAQMKEWLAEHGHEAEVWDMSQKKAKKAEFEALMRRVTGQ